MKPNIKKLLILNAPYLLFVYLFDKVGQAVRLSPGAGLSGKLLFAELYHTDDMRKCIVCGASFASKSNSVKYCPDCRKRITRRQAAERMRKKRTLVTQ